jgi:integrase
MIMTPLTSSSTVGRVRRMVSSPQLGTSLGRQNSVTEPVRARTMRLPAIQRQEKIVYHSVAQLALAFLTSLKGRPCYRSRAHTAQEWILTLPTTPTRKEILARHLAKGKGHYQPGSGQANMELGLLRTMFRWGLYHEVWDGGDPTAGIKKWKSAKRKRTGKFEELRKLLTYFDEATTEEEIRYRALFGLMLFTGCRPSEAIRAKVDAITPYGLMGSWVKGMTKTGEPQELPLPTQLMEWLAAWYAIRITDRPNAYLFPSSQAIDKPISSELVRLRWSEMRTRLGIHGLWNYDIRRTLASSMSNELGYDDSTIRAILNHNDTSALGHYRFKSFDSLTKPIQAYADWLWSLKSQAVQPLANVPCYPSQEVRA